MMTQYTPFIVLVAALLMNTLSYSSAENVYCVTPTATSCSSCPRNAHCASLSEYAQEAEHYFTSNTTMAFLPGDHILYVNITVANVTRLTMTGESFAGNRATVVCSVHWFSGSVGLSFTSMVEFKIDSLAFTSCNRKYAIALRNLFLADGVPPPSGTAIVHVALLLHSTHAELVNCSFHDNPGTALAVNNTNITLAGNTFIHNKYLHGEFERFICVSHCMSGGAITAVDSNLTFTGNTTFRENSLLYFNNPIYFTDFPGFYLGAIFTYNNTILNFIGTSNFINNSADRGGGGGAIYTYDNSIINFNGTSNFISNSADYGSAIFTYNNTIINFNGTSNFISNSADYGSAIFTYNNTIINFNGTSNFISNSADYGGAISTYNNTIINFNGTSNFINNFINNSVDSGEGGAIFTYNNTTINFNGTSNFINTSADYGGAICTYNNTIINFNGTSNFINNSADRHGGAIYTNNNTIINFNGISNFINNSADYYGGAIVANTNITLTFSRSVNFTNNVAITGGGGVYLGLKCTISIFPNTTVYWENNHAMLGGAIYVQDASPISECTPVAALVPKEECFFQLPGQNLSSGINVKLIFKNNSADDAGSILYGGAIDNCKLTDLDSHSSGKVFDMIVHIEDDNDYNTNSNISSDPLRICPCENNLPDCSKNLYHVPHAVDPGEIFQVSVVAVGQRYGAVSSGVISTIEKSPQTNSLHSKYQLQQANNTCTTFSYAVTSLSRYVWIWLHADRSPCNDILDIGVTLVQVCPPGFNLSTSARSCICEPRLAKYTNNCTITNELGKITRNEGQHFWVGYDNQSDELILHPHCPFDYCVNDTVVFPLNSTDIQCANNRSGLLCGKCKKGYSLVLGTSRCEKCTNSHLFLLIPFAVMGVALVFFLLICKLTVATGMLSGLVFYSNIVGVNRTIFLPVESTNPFSIFIAWLNLDFGIETCFYNGMDAYSKTWLQFVFPVYIWVLVGLMILVSHFSHRFARLLGNNPVSVLATLILLSYTKILRTLIAVFYTTYLEYPTYNRSVWVYDANIYYLAGKHIPLFIVAVLVFLFLFLPYTLLLLFGQWLQAISHLRLFSWVNSAKLKPFMDSYHAPYKAKHRYWPGLLLILRFVLLLVFAFNSEEDPSINLLAILVTTGLVVAMAWLGGGIYRNWCLDALECSFALNLIILAAATYHVTYHVNHSKQNQLVVGYTSVSIAFATFIGIFVFQLANATGITQSLKRKCRDWKLVIRNPEPELRSPTDSLPDRLINPEEYEQPFHTPQQHASAEPTEGANQVQKRLITPVYTYGSIN